MTYVEQYNEAMKCQTQEQADAWLETEMVRYAKEYGQAREVACFLIYANLSHQAKRQNKTLRFFAPRVGSPA